MEEVEERFKIIDAKLRTSNIPLAQLKKLTINKNKGSSALIKIISVVLIGVLLYTIWRNVFVSDTPECLLQMPVDASKVFRPPEYCDICQEVTKIDKISDILPFIFEEKYVKRTRPVVVTDGAVNWPARKLFTFKFFKDLYQSMELNRNQDKNCQFFPYQTEFQSLREVFNMSEERAALKSTEKPWYVGWNNCNDQAGSYLKQFYGRPYFLSNMTENIALTWIFMGGPGHGAHMHIDNVHYPSWQAQLSGKKLWKLAPPPECYYKCKELEVIVEPGEIIVLDTNRWYHKTTVMPGDISITIGSEFD